MISIEPSRLARLSFAASATASPPTPRPARTRVGWETQLVGALDQAPNGDHGAEQPAAEPDQLPVQTTDRQMLRADDHLAHVERN